MYERTVCRVETCNGLKSSQGCGLDLPPWPEVNGEVQWEAQVYDSWSKRCMGWGGGRTKRKGRDVLILSSSWVKELRCPGRGRG